MTPLYRAVPLLEALPADAPAAAEPMLVALPADPPAADAILEALPADRPIVAEAVLDALPVSPGPALREPTRREERGGLFRLPVRIVRGIGSMLEWLFGAVVLMGGLAVLASLPVLQLLSLGYLLEAGGRVARTGRLRNAFLGVRLAARLGGAILGSWLLLLPVRYVAQLARDAQVIDPDGPVARGWRIGLLVLIGATALHIAAACARGGRLRYFIWPFNVFWLLRRLLRGGYFSQARDAVWDVAVSLRLPYYLWMGFRGFVAAMAWLVLPVTMLAMGRLPGAAALGFLGALILGVVLLYLPFLQMRMAAENRLSAAFAVGAVRREYQRAPWAFTLAFVVTLLTALPLYLLKIEIVPREAAWLPGLVFIAFIFPARVLTGWALSRARRRESPRNWFFRWTGRLPLVPAAAFYVLIVYFTRFTSWDGLKDLYAQHAFLVPMPFFGL